MLVLRQAVGDGVQHRGAEAEADVARVIPVAPCHTRTAWRASAKNSQRSTSSPAMQHSAAATATGNGGRPDDVDSSNPSGNA